MQKKILSISTVRGVECSVFNNNIFNSSLYERNIQTEELHSCTNAVMEKSGLQFEDLEYIIVANGGIGFTSARAAVSFCVGLSLFTNAKIIGINLISAMLEYIKTNNINAIPVLPCNSSVWYINKADEEPKTIHRQNFESSGIYGLLSNMDYNNLESFSEINSMLLDIDSTSDLIAKFAIKFLINKEAVQQIININYMIEPNISK